MSMSQCSFYYHQRLASYWRSSHCLNMDTFQAAELVLRQHHYSTTQHVFCYSASITERKLDACSYRSKLPLPSHYRLVQLFLKADLSPGSTLVQYSHENSSQQSHLESDPCTLLPSVHILVVHWPVAYCHHVLASTEAATGPGLLPEVLGSLISSTHSWYCTTLLPFCSFCT